MHILITNDDGIHARGIQVLAEAAHARGHRVSVYAPLRPHSAVSHHITLSSPLVLHRMRCGGLDACAVDGTPVDNVRIGAVDAGEPIDFVLSGINNGHNAGTAIYYSGTVSAAREARMLGLKAMAVSAEVGAEDETLRYTAELALDIAEQWVKRDMPRFALLNLNVPARPVKDIKPLQAAPLSDAFFLDRYEKRVNPSGAVYYWLLPGLEMEPHTPGTDIALLEDGHAVLTLVSGAGSLNEYL